jgi:hypothetical protein
MGYEEIFNCNLAVEAKQKPHYIFSLVKIGKALGYSKALSTIHGES